jgi:peptide deformylase
MLLKTEQIEKVKTRKKVVLANKHAKKEEIKPLDLTLPLPVEKFLLLAAMAEELDGLGMAAPQLGMNQTFFVKKEPEGYRVFINPTYEKAEDNLPLLTKREACLSIPGIEIPVSRVEEILAKWFEVSEDGKIEEKQSVLTEFESRVFQHETDHCNGITILSSGILNREKRREIEKLLIKLS